jgi:hypothetical protein
MMKNARQNGGRFCIYFVYLTSLRDKPQTFILDADERRKRRLFLFLSA